MFKKMRFIMPFLFALAIAVGIAGLSTTYAREPIDHGDVHDKAQYQDKDKEPVVVESTVGCSTGAVINGTWGSDYLVGTNNNDRIDGKPGKDSLYGGDCDDVIYGGWGKDYIDGGPGYDVCYGGLDNDTFINCEVAIQ